jgi:SAM-dependent methyltransferase
VACTACGLRYTRPLPGPAELAGLYRSGYHRALSSRLWSADFISVLLERSVLWERRRALAVLPRGRLLDVGCGNGAFLARLGGGGWAVEGTDTSPAACALTRAKGVPVHEGDLAGARFPDGAFDVVTLWHVLEHLTEPLVELAEIRRILRPGGWLAIQVPDADSPTLRLCGEHWFPLSVPRHLQHFTFDSLRQTLERAGFVVRQGRGLGATDVLAAFYSFVRVLSPPGRGGVDCFGRDFRSASLAARIRFLALGIPAFVFSLLYAPCARALTGHGETITVLCRTPSA